MTKATTKKEYTIDATNRSLGRVATEIATLLMGKNDPSFERHMLADVQVTVTNVSKLHIRKKKQQNKKYAKHSGYPGSLRFETLENVLKEKGYGEVLRRAVRGMLPSNKLRSQMLNNLVIEE